MRIRKRLAVALLSVCGVICAVTPLKSADDTKPGQEDPPPPKLFTRLYDIRTLAAPNDDFPFESSPHAAAFVVPANSQERGSGYGGDRNNLFSGDRVNDLHSPTRAELIERLTKMVTDTINPDSWRDAGGTQGSVREFNGTLIITQTEAAHKEIAAFLRQLSDLHNQPVRTTAEWLLLTPAEMEKLVKPVSHRDAGAPREVDPAALERLPAAVRRFHAEIPGHDGQTLHYLSGHEKSVTVSQVVAVGTGVAGYTPVIALVADGVAIQITPVVDRERGTAVVTVFSTFNDNQEQSPPMMLHTMATTQPSPGETGVVSSSMASYHEVGSTVQEFRTTLRVPLNVPVIAGAMTLTPTARETDARQLALILCVHTAGPAEEGGIRAAKQ